MASVGRRWWKEGDALSCLWSFFVPLLLAFWPMIDREGTQRAGCGDSRMRGNVTIRCLSTEHAQRARSTFTVHQIFVEYSHSELLTVCHPGRVTCDLLP